MRRRLSSYNSTARRTSMSNIRKYIVKSVALSDNPENVELLKKLKVRCRIDGLSFSKLAVVALNEYLQRHPIPNPQLLMAYYAKPDEPTPMRVLCLYCQGAMSNGEVFCQRRGMWIKSIHCYSCKHNRLRKKS